MAAIKSDFADRARLYTSREVVVGPGLDRSIPDVRVAVPGPRPQKIVAVRVELADGEGHGLEERAEHGLHLVAGVRVASCRVAASRVADSSGVSAAEQQRREGCGPPEHGLAMQLAMLPQEVYAGPVFECSDGVCDANRVESNARRL